MTRGRQAVFALVCLAQLAVPGSLIVKHERTRTAGNVWRFQTAPVDPADPFRGRYVRLDFAVTREPVPLADPTLAWFEMNRRVYAELAVGKDGYAHLVKVHEARPAGADYIDVFAQYVAPPRENEAPRPPALFVRVPFDRYYLPEERAPEVEREYWEASRKARDRTYAEVRVRDGHAVLTRLVLDGKPVQ